MEQTKMRKPSLKLIWQESRVVKGRMVKSAIYGGPEGYHIELEGLMMKEPIAKFEEAKQAAMGAFR